MSKKFLSPIKLAQGASNPSTGSAGELFFNTTDLKVYAHNGTLWLPSGGGVTVSATAPSSPVEGDAWYNSTEGTLFIRFDGFWVESSSTVQNSEPNQIPAGAMMAWGSDTIPNSWLLCDGSAVSRSTYASLFAAIGTQYGSGDGSTTFNLPNLKGRTIVGKDSTQTEFDALGETGGAKTHTLTATQIPSHTHTFSATTSTNGSHNHINGWASITGYNYVGSGGNSTWPFGGGSNAAQRDLQAAGDHTHTVSGTTGSAGTDGAHNNLQPYIVLNYIIKFSAGETPGDSQLAVRVGAIETTTVRSVALGGTGASTLGSGGYLKGAGTSAITSQAGIPGADITSGTIDSARMPAGSLLQVVTLRYQGRPAWTFTGDSIISYLNIGITPKRANSLLIAKFIISGEMEYNGVFRGYRDGSLITQSGYEGYNTEDGSIYSGIAIVPYDGDLASTPFTQEVTYFVPANSTAATTLQIAVRPSVTSATAAIYLNRTYNSNGSSAYEIGVSYASVWEIAQ